MTETLQSTMGQQGAQAAHTPDRDYQVELELARHEKARGRLKEIGEAVDLVTSCYFNTLPEATRRHAKAFFRRFSEIIPNDTGIGALGRALTREEFRTAYIHASKALVLLNEALAALERRHEREDAAALN